jgi:hypothetical protein
MPENKEAREKYESIKKEHRCKELTKCIRNG